MPEQTPTGTHTVISDAIGGERHVFFDQIVYDDELMRQLRSAQQDNPKAKRCQCASPDCRAITRGGSFAPGHDTKLVSRLAEQVVAKSGPFAQFSLVDAQRNLFGAGGSEALARKLATAVHRREGRYQGAEISKPLRVAVKLTITITPEQAEALATEYGMETDAKSLREYVRNEVRGFADHESGGIYCTQFWTLEDE